MKTENLYKENKECCGCSMCASACPNNIIQMKPDKTGFLYPFIINEAKCLDCGKCLAVCPIKNNGNKKTDFIEFYAASYKKNKDTISCSSGGLATAISSAFIRKGGIVYGVAYSENYKEVIYCRIDKEEELVKLKGSKYVQADKRFIYKNVSVDLNKGNRCLFIGLPCDVAAVVDYFKDNKNLYTVELVCHGPTSVYVQEQYCDALKKKYGDTIKFFTNRYKKNGKWKPFYNYVEFENGKIFMEQFHKSSFGSAFRYLKRPSCYVCPFKDDTLLGDLMIGDYHYVEQGMDGYNPHGVSSAMVHNSKGSELLSIVRKDVDMVEIPKRNALANAAIHHPISAPKGTAKYKQVFLKSGLNRANRMLLVYKSNFKRSCKSNIMVIAVKLKRFLFPKSRPQ